MQRYTSEPYIPYKGQAPGPNLQAGHAVNYSKKVLLAILLFTVARLLLASVVELGNDEAYYWLYTRHLQWNYFDHPPIVALWGRLFSVNGLLDEYELFVRLGSIVGCALSTWCMYRATATLFSEKAGFYAALLYNTSLYAGIVAGLLIMPDSPQMIFWTFSLWMFARILKKGPSWYNWLLFGLGAGLCIMSKVHGVFLWGGAGLYILLHRRAWLLLPKVYASAGVTLALVSPILFWNLQYDFATYKFHSERVVVDGWVLNLRSFAEELLGQAFFNNPVNFLLILVASTSNRKQLRRHWPKVAFFCYTALPLIAVLLYLSLFRTVYPHWSGPAYVSLLPVAAAYLASKKAAPLFPAWIKASLLATFLFMAGWPLLLRYYPGTWGSKSNLVRGTYDVSLDRYGWKKAGQLFADYYRQQQKSGVIAPRTPLVCATWWGAHVDYYFGRPAGAHMMGLGSLQQVHHYLWTNVLLRDSVNMQQAFCIVPSDEFYRPAQAFKHYYRKIEAVQRITLYRNKIAARHFYVYRLSGWKGALPVMEVK